ncbi:helix-turn-helix transcriptional regulator [Glutamicibacter sp. JC586]|uniref:helix-turn-helix transcriptional regulator n=1 Tax=Glutamicibacter sp. JC586 TaxID=2590552 RepID=UPI001356E5E4|nr:helix-turn-helix transcriptional regulator [Glutamicibacter sp. JC586]
MSSNTEWPHLSAPEAVRARSKSLSQSHRRMISDLVDVRIGRGMTQGDVAAVLGVTRQRVSKMEQYDSNPRLESIRKYANAVGARIESRVSTDG